MSTQPTHSNESPKRHVTFWQMLKELLLEVIDPVSKYTSLYFITFIGVLRCPQAVVASILNPPVEPAYARRKLYTHLSLLWHNSWRERGQYFIAGLRINEHRKYYNPISFLAATVALFLLLSSLVQIQKVPLVEKYDSVMSTLLNVTPTTINGDDYDAEDREAFWKARQIVINAAQTNSVEFFRKDTILLMVLFCILTFSRLVSLAYKQTDWIELFVYGLYLQAIIIVVNVAAEYTLELINHKFQWVSDIIFYLLFFFLPGLCYARYLNNNGNEGRHASKRYFVLLYAAVAVLACYAVLPALQHLVAALTVVGNWIKFHYPSANG